MKYNYYQKIYLPGSSSCVFLPTKHKDMYFHFAANASFSLPKNKHLYSFSTAIKTLKVEY